MSINKKCPKCGSNKVQLVNERSKHGFLWFVLFGLFWCGWWLCKAMFAFMVFIFFDWWYAIIKKNQGKGYVWISKRMIENKARIYHCNECNHNFRA